MMGKDLLLRMVMNHIATVHSPILYTNNISYFCLIGVSRK